MSESKHTPGPWMRANNSWGIGCIICKDNSLEGCRKTAIAFATYREGRTDNEVEANARLIAAAPDLLEALKAAAGWFEHYANMHEAKGNKEKATTNRERVEFCRAAIAKAEGRE